jgi:hypothetical protein
MKASSLGLAALLAIASVNSATMAFAGGFFVGNFSRPAHFAHAPVNAVAAARFAHFGPAGFRRGRDRFPALFPGFIAAPTPDVAASDAPSAADGDLLAPGQAPIFSVTIVTAPPQYAYARPLAFAASGGPKIITIGAPSRSARWRKTPTIIYGSAPVGRIY